MRAWGYLFQSVDNLIRSTVYIPELLSTTPEITIKELDEFNKVVDLYLAEQNQNFSKDAIDLELQG